MAKKRFRTIQEFDDWLDDATRATRLHRRTAFERGNWAALYDAVQDSHEESKPIPEWAVDGFEKLFTGTFAEAGRPISRHKWFFEFKRDAIDWHRYKQCWFRHLGSDGRDTPPAKPKIAERAKLEYKRLRGTNAVDLWSPYPWTGDENVFQAVSLMFGRKTLYGGTEHEIRASWQRVTSAIAKGEAWRYYPSKWLRYDAHQLMTIEADEVSRREHPNLYIG